MVPRGVAAAAAQESVRLHVIRLKHARAFDVAATVNPLFGASGSLGERRGLSGREVFRRNLQ